MNPDGKIDLAEVERLVHALEQDLDRVKEGSRNYEALRAEVEALRQALNREADDDAGVRERLHGVRAWLDEAASFETTQYIARIGRMLGM